MGNPREKISQELLKTVLYSKKTKNSGSADRLEGENMIFVHLDRSDFSSFPPGKTAESLSEALNHAEECEGIAVFAADYPACRDSILCTCAQLEQAREKKLRLYLEYPEQIPGIELGACFMPKYERTVVAADNWCTLARGTILAQHSCFVRACRSEVAPLLVSAKVAGYRDTVYGLPDCAAPLLFFHPDYPNVMIALTAFSRFARGRFAPVPDWRQIWEGIFAHLGVTFRPDWVPEIRPAYAREEKLPSDAADNAFQNSIAWFTGSMISVHTGEMVMEGVDSMIDCNGNQKLRTHTRGDCVGESTLPLALDWRINRNPQSRDLCGKLMNYLFTAPEIRCLDPGNPCYGMLNFFENVPTFYGDDNCRAFMSALIAGALTGEYRWNREILRGLLNVLRTTGKLGFRRTNLKWPQDFNEGRNWDFYRDEECVNYRPHSQGWMWAAFLLAWRWTGYRVFLEKARRGIGNLMRVYPGQIQWTNGFSQEIARMLLPLALLLRIEDTSEHRDWLMRVWRDLQPLAAECGAIREIMGKEENGLYPAPRSNEEYGTNEAALIQRNGDPVCDLLYTVNFAFPGLQEAAGVTGDAEIGKALSRLENFLIRIQVHSEKHPLLAGAWLRGFDWELWDYYGSSADLGWGVWCAESGWTNSWIASTLALRRLGCGLWDLVPEHGAADILPELLNEMEEIRPFPLLAGAFPQSVPGAEN